MALKARVQKCDLFHVRKGEYTRNLTKAPDKDSILTTVERMGKSSILTYQQRNYTKDSTTNFNFKSLIQYLETKSSSANLC